MCEHCFNQAAGPSRRSLLVGMAAAAAATMVPRVVSAATGSACFTPQELAGTAAERLRRRPTAEDAVTMPAPAAPGEPVAGALAGVIRGVVPPAGSKPIALTFDLCQTRGSIAGYDGAVVDYLRSQEVPATFFAGGLWLPTHRERAIQLAADPLFVLGNHSWTHHDLHSAPASVIAGEILTTEAMLAETRRAAHAACSRMTASAGPRLFRFPYGSCAPAAVAAANAVGSIIIQWDVVSGDPDGTPAASIVRSVLGEARPGSIVVMHANGRGTHTAEALATIVPKLRAAGYRFVTVDRLLESGRPVAATECYIEREGDTARYDNPSAFKAARMLKKAAAG